MHVLPSGCTAIPSVQIFIGTSCCIPRGPCGREEGEAEWEEEEDKYDDNSDNGVFGIGFHPFFGFGYIFPHRMDGSQFTKRVFGSAEPDFVCGRLTAWPVLGVLSLFLPLRSSPSFNRSFAGARTVRVVPFTVFPFILKT